jgi:hypothetical protein
MGVIGTDAGEAMNEAGDEVDHRRPDLLTFSRQGGFARRGSPLRHRPPTEQT